jgi:hypothetical protein
VPKNSPAIRELVVKFTLNGRSCDATALMIHDVFDRVTYASNILTLQPGDVIATGSPAGVGSARKPPIFFKAGDLAVCLGVALTNPVVGPRRHRLRAFSRLRHLLRPPVFLPARMPAASPLDSLPASFRRAHYPEGVPELPEVESVRRRLEPFMTGARFDGVDVHRPDLRRAFPRRFGLRLKDETVLALTRRAKYLLAALSSNETLLMHLGMSGSFRVVPDAGRIDESDAGALFPRDPHDHVVFHMSSRAICLQRSTSPGLWTSF